MSATYFFALTDYGSSVVAQAHNQRNIELFNLVLGDANGQPYNPLDRKSFDTLVNQRASVPVQSVTAIGEICRVISTIDSQIGGFNIHELGLTDATGKLVYVGNYHGGYKPELENGAFGELELIIDIKAEAGSNVLIEVSPNAVTANKKWVLEQLEILKKTLIERHDIDIGDLLITTNHFENSAEVTAFKGYGEWERFGDGHALVALAHLNDQAPDAMKIVGGITGQFKQDVLTENLPEHNHIDDGSPYNKLVAAMKDITAVDGDGGGEIRPVADATNVGDNRSYIQVSDISVSQFEEMRIKPTGQGVPLDIVQPSIAVEVWKRTA